MAAHRAGQLTRPRWSVVFRPNNNNLSRLDRACGEYNAMRCLRLVCYAVALTGLLLSGRPGFAEDTIKIAYTDPFSGPFASGGDEFLKVFQFIIARKNAMGGVLGKKLELVPFDDKLQPAEALIALKNRSEERRV